jgi:2,3-bisphosphoglycerate-independent phosphoglycerate mutase
MIFVMIDGLGDHSHAKSDQKHETPLQTAHTPSLDFLAAQDCFGVHDPV